MIPQHAISVYSPWGWALIHAGKPVENRSLKDPRFNSRKNPFFGRVWIHCSKWPCSSGGEMKERHFEELYEEWLAVKGCIEREHVLGSMLEMPKVTLNDLCEMRGHIIGSVEVYEYRTPDDPPDSPWYVPGSLAIMVSNPKPLASPVSAKGARGWWVPPEDVRMKLELAT